MTQLLVIYEPKPPAVVLTLNRPDKRNALNRQLITELSAAFDHAVKDPACRVVIVTGAGPAFCAGMDLAELLETLDQPNEAEIVQQDAQRLSQLLDKMFQCPKPTIAAVNGAALAGGAGLVTACDLALAVPDAKFGYPEARRGLVAAMVMPHLLRHVGERAARDLLLRCELIDAMAAWRIGLINEVVTGDLLTAALDWARSIALSGPQALATTKALLARFAGPEDVRAEMARGSAFARLTVECKEGLRAFLEKRSPPWAPQ
jgi:methylglutaconyl-CoA hydratase